MTINLTRQAADAVGSEVNLHPANARTGPPGEAQLGRGRYTRSSTGPPVQTQNSEINTQIMQHT